MPRKKRMMEDGDIEVQRPIIEMDPQDAMVRKILSSMPGGIKCMNLFRYPEGNKGGRPSYIDEISPEQFSFHYIKQSYGGGRFFVEWTDDDGTIRRSNFDVAGPFMNFNESKHHVEEVEKEYIPGQQAHFPQPVQQSFDPMMMLRMMQDARKEAREEMRTMMEYMRPAPPPPDMTKQVFEIVEKLVPMMNSGDGGSPWMMALAQFKEPILKIVDSVHTALTRPQVTVPSSQPVAASVVQSSMKQEDDMIGLMIRQALPILINGASKNADTAFYADLVLDQVPESAYTKLAQWLQAPNCLEDIAKIEPGIRFQQDWWNSLRSTLLETIQNATTDIQPATDPEHNQN